MFRFPGQLRKILALGSLPLLLGGCLLGPDYERPEVAEPAAFRGVEGSAQAESIADANWSTVTNDPVLQELIQTAITNNLDLRVATARVTEARARYGIVHSFIYPEVGVAGGYSSEQNSQLADQTQGSGESRSYQNWDVGVQASWELDLFGRIRRESEAAFAEYLATEEGQRAVLVSLVGDVASTYLLMRQLDMQLEIARQTSVTNEETVEFYRKRLAGGLSNRLELDTAVANLARTNALIPAARKPDRGCRECPVAAPRSAAWTDQARRSADVHASADHDPGGAACGITGAAARCDGG